jgi:hypothetical protein
MKKARLTDGMEDWWNIDPANKMQLAGSVFSRHQELRNNQSRELIDLALSVYMYHGASAGRLLGVLGLPQLTVEGGWSAVTGPVHNITSVAIDTIASLLSLNKPKATFLTTGGDWGQRERAQLLTDFTEGLFLQNDVYQLGPDLAMDAMVYGDGIAKVWIDRADEEPRVRFSRVTRPNLTIDLAEGVDRNPRQMYERRFITRDQLAGLFDKSQKQIDRAPLASGDSLFYPRSDRAITHNVEVIEAWKLPDGKRPGRHVIAIQNWVLFQEDWLEPDFPFVFLKYKKPRMGFWGIGLAHELRSLQLSTNRLDEYISETIRRISRGRVWVPEGARISISQLGNKIAGVFQYSGLRPPIIDNSNAVPSEMIEERQEKLNSWGPVAGVGQDIASAQMPASLRSGPAQRERMQFQDKRLNVIEDNYAYDLFMGLARKGIKLVRRCVEDGGEYEVKLSRNGIVEFLDFKNANIEDEEVELQLSPTNFLADDPADRKDQIVDLGNAGILDKAQMVDGLNYADIRTLTDPITAGVRNSRWIVRELQKGRLPDLSMIDFMDIEHGIPDVHAAMLDAMPFNPPDSFMTNCAQWLSAAQRTQAKRQAAIQLQAMASGGPATGSVPANPPVAPTAALAPAQGRAA